eukprot:Trichotokara_eunicae@DN8535_c0_g1_i1.p1
MAKLKNACHHGQNKKDHKNGYKKPKETRLTKLVKLKHLYVKHGDSLKRSLVRYRQERRDGVEAAHLLLDKGKDDRLAELTKSIEANKARALVEEKFLLERYA